MINENCMFYIHKFGDMRNIEMGLPNGSIVWSINPIFLALTGLIFLPVNIISIAFATVT